MLPFDRSWAASASNVSVVLVVKNLPANAEIRHRSSIPRSKDPLEEGTATHSSILAWRIPWTEEPGGLQSLECKEVYKTEAILHTHMQAHINN